MASELAGSKPIKFACDCGRRLQVAGEYVGKKGQCPRCGKILRIPTPSAATRSTAIAPTVEAACPVTTVSDSAPKTLVPANSVFYRNEFQQAQSRGPTGQESERDPLTTWVAGAVLAAICVVVGIVASEHSLPDTPPPLATTLEANENEAPLLGNDPIASPSRADDVAVVPLEIIEPVGQPVLVDLKAIANISDNTEPVGQPVVVAPESIVPAPTEPANTPALTPEQIIARVEKSVVFIQVEYPSHSICLGSGFVVNDNGIIATNYHMIEGARSVKIRFHDGQEQDATGWVAISETKDLALIQCPMPRETLRPLSLSASTPSKGAAVYAFWQPRGS